MGPNIIILWCSMHVQRVLKKRELKADVSKRAQQFWAHFNDTFYTFRPIYKHNTFLLLLVSCLKAKPMERWSSRRAAKPFYWHNTLPATAYSNLWRCYHPKNNFCFSVLFFKTIWFNLKATSAVYFDAKAGRLPEGLPRNCLFQLILRIFANTICQPSVHW